MRLSEELMGKIKTLGFDFPDEYEHSNSDNPLDMVSAEGLTLRQILFKETVIDETLLKLWNENSEFQKFVAQEHNDQTIYNTEEAYYTIVTREITETYRQSSLFRYIEDCIQATLDEASSIISGLNIELLGNGSAYLIHLSEEPKVNLFPGFTFYESHLRIDNTYSTAKTLSGQSGFSCAHLTFTYLKRDENEISEEIKVRVYFDRNGNHINTIVKKNLLNNDLDDENTTETLPADRERDGIILKQAKKGKELLSQLITEKYQKRTDAMQEAQRLDTALATKFSKIIKSKKDNASLIEEYKLLAQTFLK